MTADHSARRRDDELRRAVEWREICSHDTIPIRIPIPTRRRFPPRHLPRAWSMVGTVWRAIPSHGDCQWAPIYRLQLDKMTRRPIVDGKRSVSDGQVPLESPPPSLVNDESSLHCSDCSGTHPRTHTKRKDEAILVGSARVCLSKITTTSSSPSPRGRPKSHGKVGRPWSRRNPINLTRRGKCRSEVQSGSWRLQQAPRSKRRLTLGTLPCQIVSNHAAKLPRVPSASSCREILCMEKLASSRPRRVLVLWQCCLGLVR